MEKEELREYLNAQYYGVLKGQYEKYCPLNYEEIPVFVQNVGRFSDLEVINIRDQEVLFDTHGQFINRIYPELSPSDRNNNVVRKMVNQIANQLNLMTIENKECYKANDNVRNFIEETLGKEKAQKNDEMIKAIESDYLEESINLEIGGMQ